VKITDSDKIDAASRIWRSIFQSLFENGGQGSWPRFCRKVSTDAKSNTDVFLGSMPSVRKWVGEKQYQAMRAYDFTVTLASYESSFELERKDIRYDSVGAISQRISAFLNGVADEFYDGPATDEVLLANPTCYDGVNLYSASHVHVNGGAGGSNYTTSALSFATYAAAKVAITGLRDERNKSFKLRPKTLMVGPALEHLAKEITQSKTRIIGINSAGDETGARVAASTIENVYGGGEVDLVINPRLVGTYANYWFLFSDQNLVCPVLCYVGRDVEEHSITAMDSETRFRRDKFAWSGEADLGFGPGMWIGSYGGFTPA
jgi:phage major head subunit gpT-like protein